jgi:hypothetical protein
MTVILLVVIMNTQGKESQILGVMAFAMVDKCKPNTNTELKLLKQYVKLTALYKWKERLQREETHLR